MQITTATGLPFPPYIGRHFSFHRDHRHPISPIISIFLPFPFLPLFHFFLARNSFLIQTYNRKNRSGTRLIREKNSVSRLNKDTNFAPFSANEKKKKKTRDSSGLS